MTLTEIIAQIEAAIIANGTGAITAEVLNPILLGMVGQINDLTGELDDSTVEGDTIIEMINALNEALGEIVSPTIYTGSGFPSPLSVPDATTGDYYLQTSGPSIENSYIYNGIGWVNLKNWINDAEVSEETTWSSQKIKEYLDAVDKLISVGTIEIEAGFAIIPAGAYWRIGGVYYSNAAEVSIAIPAASAGMYRTDLLVANTSGGFERVAGTESATYLSPPPPTAGTVAVAPVTVYGGDITVTTPDIDAGEFVKKSFYNYIEFPGGGADAVIPLDYKGRSEIRLVDDTLVSVAGVDLSAVESVEFPEVPYKGKLYILRNLTANPVNLLHGSGAADIPFASFGDVDLEVPVSGAIIFSYAPDICTILFKNWETGGGGGAVADYLFHSSDWKSASFALNTWTNPGPTNSNFDNDAFGTYGTGLLPADLHDYASWDSVPDGYIVDEIEVIVRYKSTSGSASSLQIYVDISETDFSNDTDNVANTNVIVNEVINFAAGDFLRHYVKKVTVGANALPTLDKAIIFKSARETTLTTQYGLTFNYKFKKI